VQRNFKRIISLLLVLILCFSLFEIGAVIGEESNPLLVAYTSVEELTEDPTAGEKLKEMGIVKGYADGELKENKEITEGELLCLISRTIKKINGTSYNKLVKEVNGFDRFVNSVYNWLKVTKENIIKGYYRFLALFPTYEVLPGIRKDNWLFEDALYLKTTGFHFPEDFSPNRKISEYEMYQLLIDGLNLGEKNETIVFDPEISEKDRLKVILITHGIYETSPDELNFAKRNEAFNLILNVVQK